MSDFKWEMQERIDRGMNPDEAYHATREAYADAADIARKARKENPPDPRFCPLCGADIDGNDPHGPTCPRGEK